MSGRNSSLDYVTSARSQLRQTKSKYSTPPPPPPPPPQSAPPPGSNTDDNNNNNNNNTNSKVPSPTSYRITRQSELDSLRKKGLAKIFNRHFTTVTQNIANERAATENALREIEARKAALKASGKTHESGVGGVSMTVLDNMYLEMQKKREEAKKKERDTMLLYRSYVSKFGDLGGGPNNTPGSGAGVMKRTRSGGIGGYIVEGGTEGDAAPPANVVRQADLQLARQTETKNLPSSVVPERARQIEGTVESNAERGAYKLPSVATVGADKTWSDMSSTEQKREQIYERRLLEDRGVDAKASPVVPEGKKTIGRRLVGTATPGSGGDIGAPPVFGGESPQTATSPPATTSKNKEISPSPSSAVPQSRMHLVPADMSESERALRSRAQGGRGGGGGTIDKWEGKLGSNPVLITEEVGDDDRSDYLNRSFHSDITSSVISESSAPVDITDDEEGGLVFGGGRGDVDDDDVLSVVSGLTSLNSQTMSDAELRLAEFLRNETDAIRKMLEEEVTDNRSVVSTEASVSEESQRAKKAAMEAENMAKMMEDAVKWAIDAVESGGSSGKGAATPEGKGREVGRSKTERWYAYWSEEHQREYYHEVKSGRVEWTLPDRFVDTARTRRTATVAVNGGRGTNDQDDDEYSVEVKDFTKKKRMTSGSSVVSEGTARSAASRSVMDPSVVSHEDFMPEYDRPSRSRRDVYRKRMIKKKNRRKALTAVGALMAFSGGALYYYKIYHIGAGKVGLMESVVSLFKSEPKVEMKVEEKTPKPGRTKKTKKKDKPTIDKDTDEKPSATKKHQEEINKVTDRTENSTPSKRQVADAPEKREKLDDVPKKETDPSKTPERQAQGKTDLDPEKRTDTQPKQAVAQEGKEQSQLTVSQPVEESKAQGTAADTKSLPSTPSDMSVTHPSSRDVATRQVQGPIGCFIPFAYIFAGVCRRRPIFDLQKLTDSMMQ